MLSRKITNVYNDLARKYRNVTVKDFGKYDKLQYKKTKQKQKQKQQQQQQQQQQPEMGHSFSEQLQTIWCVSEILYI